MSEVRRRFEYVVWLRDRTLPWPSAFYIDAATEHDALSWGDRLAASYYERGGDEFVRSSVSTVEGASAALPGVVHGHAATDDEIGW